MVQNINDAQTKDHQRSLIIDTNSIYNKIFPYLSHPEVIKQFLDMHSNVTIDKLIILIEAEIKNCDPIKCTDFRIMLNSI